MKFALVALFAALCLVAGSANATIDGAPIHDEVDLQYKPENFANNELVHPEALLFIPNIFGPMYWIMKGALRTLKGINCSIKGVINIKYSAQTFIDDVQSCGGVVSSQVQSVVTACKTVISTANAIITLNDAACKNGNYNDATDGTKKTPYFSCFTKMLNRMLQLNQQIKKVVTLIKKVPNAGVGAGVCVRNALNDLSLAFTQFPAMVKTCSKLTS